MEIRAEGRKVMLKGFARLCKTMVSLKTMSRQYRSMIGLFVGVVEYRGDSRSRVNSVSRVCSAASVAVFQQPSMLALPRENEHTIALKEGVPLISVRPYQYP